MGTTIFALIVVMITIVTYFESYQVSCLRAKKLLLEKKAVEFLETGVLPFNQQVSTFLKKGSPGTFLILDIERLKHPLSITIIPCSSTIQWFVWYKHENETGVVNRNAVSESDIIKDRKITEEYTGRGIHRVKIEDAKTGLYLVQVVSIDEHTNIQIFVTMDLDGPYDLTIPQDSKIKFLLHQRKKAVSVRWEQSLVNPQTTHYCLTINTKHSFSTLCEAEGERYGIYPSHTNSFIYRTNTKVYKKMKFNRSNSYNSDISIVCVKKKTSFTFHNLTENKQYYIDLFATNVETQLTIPYGSSVVKYDLSPKYIILRDGEPISVNMKKYEGRLSFRFRVNENAEELHFYIMPCGGSVKAQVTSQREIIQKTKPVHGYQRIIVDKPILGQKYVLKISSLNIDELSQTKSIEVFATLHPFDRFPLPEIPDEPIVYEYAGSRRCDTISIGWVPARDVQPTKYCVYSSEVSNDDTNTLDINDQCSFLKLTSRRDRHWYKNCTNVLVDNRNAVVVTTHTISDLKPGKTYLIQVTGKKKYGRTLSYRLLRVKTKSLCD